MSHGVRCFAPLLAFVVLLLLSSFARSDYYQLQPFPDVLNQTISSNCTLLSASSELVAAYGQQYVGLCAWSFCYQLYSTPFPNQDPSSTTYTMSGYLFTDNEVTVNTPAYDTEWTQTPYGYANNVSYTLAGVVGVRRQSQFMFDQSCGALNPTANITGLSPSYEFADQLLLTAWPYMTAAGWSLGLDQSVAYVGYLGGCTPWVQVASNVYAYFYTDIDFPQTSSIAEIGIGATNYAKINVQPYVEGSGTSYPYCPYYEPPTTTILPFAYFVQQSLANGAVQSSCVSGSLTVSGPYTRFTGYQSYFVVNATGTRSFTDVHNRTTVQRIIGIGLPTPITTSTVFTPDPRTTNGSPDQPTYPLWPDNAINIDSAGNAQPTMNGILFQLDGIPYSGATAIAETPYVLFARGLSDGWVAEIAQVDQSTSASNWANLYHGQGKIISSGSDSNFSFIVGSNSWKQSTVYSGLTCPVGVPSVSWTPGTTNYADPAGLTQVGFGYRSVIGYTSSGQPATSVCIAGILTLDLLVPGDGVRAMVTSATGVRVFSTSTGQVSSLQLLSVPYWAWNYLGAVPSYWFYKQSNPLDDGTSNVANGISFSSFGLLFNGTVYGPGGTVGASSTSLNWYNNLAGTSAGTGLLIEYEPFTYIAPPYQPSSPPTFTVFPLTGAGSFVPSTYCPSDTSLLATAPGASSTTTNTLPQKQLSISYGVVPNNFLPGNRWIVCTNLNVTLSATSTVVGTSSGPYANFFQAVNASGLRAFFNLDTGLGAITSIIGLADLSQLSSLQITADNLVSVTTPYLSFNGLALLTSSPPTYSSGAFGPSALALGLQQSINTVTDGAGHKLQQVLNSPGRAAVARCCSVQRGVLERGHIDAAAAGLQPVSGHTAGQRAGRLADGHSAVLVQHRSDGRRGVRVVGGVCDGHADAAGCSTVPQRQRLTACIFDRICHGQSHVLQRLGSGEHGQHCGRHSHIRHGLEPVLPEPNRQHLHGRWADVHVGQQRRLHCSARHHCRQRHYIHRHHVQPGGLTDRTGELWQLQPGPGRQLCHHILPTRQHRRHAADLCCHCLSRLACHCHGLFRC